MILKGSGKSWPSQEAGPQPIPWASPCRGGSPGHRTPTALRWADRTPVLGQAFREQGLWEVGAVGQHKRQSRVQIPVPPLSGVRLFVAHSFVESCQELFAPQCGRRHTKAGDPKTTWQGPPWSCPRHNGSPEDQHRIGVKGGRAGGLPSKASWRTWT